ncbi:CBS domain-containing protein [Salinifilum aidingensis]
MTTARDMMTEDTVTLRTDATAADAARVMTEHGIGSIPVRGHDNQLKGLVTDRDLVRKVVAQGRDAGTFPAGDLTQSEPASISADASETEVVDAMIRHGVRRLPVVDGERLVGVISLADVVQVVPEQRSGELVAQLSR